MRRGHGSLYDIAVPGYKANLSDVLASIALVQLDKVERHAEIRRRQVAIYDEGDRRPRRDRGRSRAIRATCTRTTSTSCASRSPTATRCSARSTDENIGTSIHFLPVHRLSAYRDRLAPHQPPLPVTERAGAEVLSLPLSPAHSDDDIRDAVAALRRVHERLSG